jgi:Flp pilus assembly pilin Flp
MLKYYIKFTEALRRLRPDQDGALSFEYVVLAFCIVATVILVFNPAGNSTMSNALNTAINNIVAKLPT